MGDWTHGLFGCFDNCGLCVISYFIPCYQFGKNAEAVGESFLMCCLCYLIPGPDLIAAVSVRSKIREQRGIEGSICGDCLTIAFCPLCALVQEAQETQSADPTRQHILRV